MPTSIKFRGGTYTEHQSFTGAEREITVDTTSNTVVVHDGSTLGGFPLALADLSNVSGGVPTEAIANSGETTPESCSTEGVLFFNTAEGELYVCKDGVYELSTVAASGIPSGASTPTSCTVSGELFYNTTEEKLYACNGSTYETAVPDVAAIVTYGSSTPASCSTTGALFYNTAEEVLYTCDGSVYVSATNVTTATGTSTPASCSVEGGFFFNTAEQKLYICDSGTYTLAVPESAQIADGSITATAFASSISPVEIFATNPTTDNYEGRMVYNTTDNKLYRYDGTEFTSSTAAGDLTGEVVADQIAANAITAGKIAAGAVSATEIATDAITSDKILAGSVISDKIASNAIVSGKISAGAVDATAIATNAITADKISSGSVTAAKIQAGAIDATKIAASAITADKIDTGAITSTKIATNAITAGKVAADAISVSSLQSNTSDTFNGMTFALGSSATVAGYTGAAAFTGSQSGTYGILCANSSGSAIGAGTVSGAAGSFVCATSTSYSSFVTTFEACNPNVAGNFGNDSGTAALLATDSYGADLTGGVAPFTGCHDGLIAKTDTQPTAGDILVDSSVYATKGVSDAICVNTLSTSANQKGAIGVFVNNKGDNEVSCAVSVSTTDPVTGFTTKSIDPAYTDIGDYNNVAINSVGEGLINVCGEGGNIEVGDLIVTSSTAGKGMKQADDIVRSYTVAKARQAVTFSDPSEVQQIACIYMCG
jgi:hypothetical protein